MPLTLRCNGQAHEVTILQRKPRLAVEIGRAHV